MNRRKSLVFVILTAVLLTFAVGSTVAFLQARTGTVTNTFQPTKLETAIEEGFSSDNTVKTSICVRNASDSVRAWVRVAVIGNWCDKEGKIVEPWTLPAESLNAENWKQEDGYYYYKSILEPGAVTENLLNAGKGIAGIDNTSHPDQHLVVTVIQQAIQAEGKDQTQTPAEQVWGVN